MGMSRLNPVIVWAIIAVVVFAAALAALAVITAVNYETPTTVDFRRG